MRIFKKLSRKVRGNKQKEEWKKRTERDKRNITEFLNRNIKTSFNCVDVGAHKGLFLKHFLTLAPLGRHLGIEPIPGLAQALSENFPGINIINCALSNRSGTARFYWVPDVESWSGLEKQKYPKNAEPEEIEVQLKKLDDIIETNLHIDFIKIDVEGAELEVLQGGLNTIKRCKPMILFEHAKIHNENYKTTPHMIYDFFTEECGMTICDLEFNTGFSREDFIRVYFSSFESGYDRDAQTNFIARP